LIETEFTFPEFGGPVEPAQESSSFQESLRYLKRRLTALISKLPLRNHPLNMHIDEILMWADFARRACRAHLSFAHPIWIISTRLREFDRQIVIDKRHKFLEEEAAQRSLARDFEIFRLV
jgi:hypothetical protein